MSEDEKTGWIKAASVFAKGQPVIAGMLLLLIVMEFSSYYRAILRAELESEARESVTALLNECIGVNYPP